MPLELLILCPTVVLLIPGVVLLIESLAAGPATGGPGHPAGGPVPRVALLIPAHNEAGQIAATVGALAVELVEGDRLVVIADNCSDATAATVSAVPASPRGAATSVIERHDPRNIGKGFAISFGVEHLATDPPEVVILVDADCRVSPGAIAILAREAIRCQRPVQGEYLLSASPDAGPLARVSALALLVRNRVRPRGLKRLGLPCLLTGSGMAFPWKVLSQAPATRGNLVEDMVLGLELALQGHPPLFCPEAQISSELPDGRSAGLRQRRRWEHGQLHALVTYVPRLLAAGIARGNAGLLGLAADLLVPPLALLVILQGAMLGATLGLWAMRPAVVAPLGFAAAGLAASAVAVLVAWWRFARSLVPLRILLVVPAYLLWKIPLYASLFLRGKQRTWERTARRGEGGTGSDPKA